MDSKLSQLKNIYTGSVKDIYQKDDTLIFHFTNRYSIYDWGQMPDLIEQKGEALATTARLIYTMIADPIFWHNWKLPDFVSEKIKTSLKVSKTYSQISHAGLNNHFLAQVDDDLNPSEHGQNIMVKKVDVHRPQVSASGYDYSVYKKKPTNALIPLEVIFRMGLPTGSSFPKRAAKDVEYLKTLGVTKLPQEGQFFDFPVVEFSTKLEPRDRYLSYHEAADIAGMEETELHNLIETTQILSLRLYQLFKSSGLELWDGKFEFAWDTERNLMLVDSIGLDEMRVMINNNHLSKEFLRQFYVDTNWYHQLSHYKNEFGDRWKFKMLEDGLKPRALTPEYKKLAENLYQAFVNTIAVASNEKPVFHIAMNLSEWNEKVEQLLRRGESNVLVIGQGGREHALSWKLAESNSVKFVWVAPGNPGMVSTKVATCNIDFSNKNNLLEFISQNDIDLVVIGPEAPLVDGMADILRKDGIAVFGPSKEGALLEASKDFSKAIMRKAKIPTAEYETFEDPEAAFRFIDNCNWPDGIVIKMDGLAAGKGVVVCNNKSEARKAIKELVIDNALGLDNTRVVIEERLIGPEVSAFALIDGSTFKSIGQACDYKRIRDNDEGPNTGGMGTYSPADWLTNEDIQEIEESVFRPLVYTLQDEKIDYRGVLFVGLMKTTNGLKVLEFNVRFGDPETQSLLPRIKSDFFHLIKATANGKLESLSPIEFYDTSVVHVVAAAKGYPGTEGEPVSKGDQIHIEQDLWKLDSQIGKVFFAGVSGKKENLKTSGGRVLGVSAYGKDRESARAAAYELIKKVRFEGMQYRGDIAKNSK